MHMRLREVHRWCISTSARGPWISISAPFLFSQPIFRVNLFCKVIRKPLPDMHELQCVRGVLSSKYRTTDLGRLPATTDLHTVSNTTRITLTKAVALMHEANPTAV